MTTRPAPIITGRGWITALGRGIDPVMDRLERGETGIATSRRIDVDGLRNDQCGEVEGDQPQDPHERSRALLTIAIEDALVDAGLTPETLSPTCLVVLGTSFGTIFHNAEGPVALDAVFAEALQAMGIARAPIMLSAACSSSSEALGLGYDMIALGHADQVIAVGVDILDRYKMAGHSSLSTMSPDRCRPFDVAGNGTILGEGAAAVVLEAPAYAEGRGAPQRGRLSGVASTTDTSGATSPDPEGGGATRVLVQALARAGRVANDVAYVNAHGSGTPVNDAMEAKAFARVFQRGGPPVSSTKPAFGHTLGATGIIEAVVALEALRRKRVPPTVGLADIAPEADGLLLVQGTAIALPVDAPCAISVTYGFGGANTALVVELGAA